LDVSGDNLITEAEFKRLYNPTVGWSPHP